MDKFEDLVPAERAQRASRRTIPASMLRDVCCALRARRQRPRRRRAAEKGNELAAATHSITSSAWDEAGRHFGRAAEQVQTRAAAISEAWSAEFLSRDVQHQPLTLSLARRDRWVLFPLTQTVLWVHRWLGAVLGDCAFSISARHKLKNVLMIIATIGPLELAGLVAAYASTSRTRTESVELARQCWKAVLTG